MYTSIMIRTQIYLPDDLHSQLIQLARAKSTSMAEVTRNFIEKGLKTSRNIDTSGKTVMRKIANMNIKKGPKDLSYNLDHYLYGAPKKHP